MYPQTQMVSRRYRFDAFEVDTRIGLLRQDGAAVPLQDIPFRFLVALLEHPGELRSRDELRNDIWPADVNLDFEGALRTAVHKVRQALGDSSQLPRYIETLPGRGFRFLGEVVAEFPDHSPTAHGTQVPFRPRKRLPVWTAAAMLAGMGALLLLRGNSTRGFPPQDHPVHLPSVVALPTTVYGGADSAFFADAIPDTLSTLLGNSEGLETKVPPTSVQVERIRGDVAKIAEAYRADFLIHTAVTVEPERLLLNVKLAEASTRKVRWASQYEAARDNYNGLLRDAAQAISAVLDPGAGHKRGGGQPVFSSPVELALREGRYFQRKYQSSKNPHDFDLALAAFRKAQSLDPSSALLVAEIAHLFEQQHFHTQDPKAWGEAEQWVARALALDPRCGRAWGVRSWIETSRPKVDPAAVVEFALKAARFSPRDSKTYITLACVAPTAAYGAAAGLLGAELNPLDPDGYSVAAFQLPLIGKAEEGLRIIERANRLDIPEGFHTWIRYFCYFHAGRFEEAKPAYTEVEWPGASRLMRSLMGGEASVGKEMAMSIRAKWRTARSGPMDWTNRLIFYGPLLVRLGLNEDALWLLERCTEANSPPPYDFLLVDPDMQKIKGDRRYSKALAASRKYALLFLKQADAARAQGEYPKQLERPLAELRALLEQPPRG